MPETDRREPDDHTDPPGGTDPDATVATGQVSTPTEGAADTGSDPAAAADTGSDTAVAPRRAATEPRPRRTSPRDRQPDSAKARRRTIDSLLKPTRAQLTVAVVLCLVGLAVTTQIQSQRSQEGYANARREDLIQLLDGINAETRRLESESTELERSRTQLATGADAEEAAREEARRQQETLSVLAGTAPAAGPGIRMVIADPQGKITSGMLLDAVEEMRDAGAEVIEINDEVRVVANSWFASGPDGLVVDDQRVTSPITLEVIGEPRTLAEAARFRGGFISEITSPQVAATVTLDEVADLQVTSLHQPKANQYARPAPEPQR